MRQIEIFSTSSSEISSLLRSLSLIVRGALVIGDLLRGFECAVVFEVRGDTSRAEGVVANARLDASAGRAVLNHAVGVLLPHVVARKFAGPASSFRRAGPKLDNLWTALYFNQRILLTLV